MNVLRFALLAAALSALAACSAAPVGGAPELDMTTTGSITRPDAAPAVPLGYASASPLEPVEPTKPKSVIEGVAPSDWEAIRLFASTHIDRAKDGDVLDWTNPETGSNGTISPLAASRSEGGRQCRPIGLTISDVRGIRRYHGDACHASDGMWQLVEITAEDGALL